MSSDLVQRMQAFPQYFYDSIVYFSSSILFFTAVLMPTAGISGIHTTSAGFSASEWVVSALIGISACYTWGQLSSTFSYHMVKKPVTRFVKKRRPRGADDFLFEQEALVHRIDSEGHLGAKAKRNYWTIMYFLGVLRPDIGNDLMKRYARCKLARVNAFNSAILSLGSLAFLVVGFFGVDRVSVPISAATFAGGLAAAVVFVADFYQRQCWFGDLVVKAFFGVVAAQNQLARQAAAAHPTAVTSDSL